jgi:two-component system response regulator (stage 0 sporulation protein A)
MSNLEKKVDALVRLALSESSIERTTLMWQLKDLMTDAPEPCAVNTEIKVRRILLKIGVPDNLLGHSYLVSAIELVADDATLGRAITKELYPKLAGMHLTTPSRVERAIRHAIEVAWNRADLDVVLQYFGYTVSIDKGKPTNSEFIARLASVVRETEKM